MIGIADYLIDVSDIEFIHRIGTGQLGIVHLAKNVNTGEEMALKFFDVNTLYSVEQKSFLKKVTNLVALKHQAILPIVAYMMPTPVHSTESLRSAIGTMYMSKGTLLDLMKDDDAKNILTGTRKSIIAYGIASAMKFAHMNGINHHNLKPTNILLDQRYAPKVADFQFIQPPQLFGIRSMNTILFAAPEILRGSTHLNLEADVYSFGMILLYLFTMKMPYDIDAECINQFVDDVCNGLKKPTIPENMPQKLKDLINGCLKYEPEERPTFERIIDLFDTWMNVFPDTNFKEYNAYKSKINVSEVSWVPSKIAKERDELINLKKENEEERKRMEIERAQLNYQRNEIIKMREIMYQQAQELEASRQMLKEENEKLKEEKNEIIKCMSSQSEKRNQTFLNGTFDNVELRSVPISSHQRRATSITAMKAFSEMLEHNKKYQDEKKE